MGRLEARPARLTDALTGAGLPAAVGPQGALDAGRRPRAPEPRRALAELDGVGPATASAVAAAAAPEVYPFFDELVAAQVTPALGEVAFTPAFYAKYADALRQRASALGAGWTPVMVERALWAHVGGKKGTRSAK